MVMWFWGLELARGFNVRLIGNCEWHVRKSPRRRLGIH